MLASHTDQVKRIKHSLIGEKEKDWLYLILEIVKSIMASKVNRRIRIWALDIVNLNINIKALNNRKIVVNKLWFLKIKQIKNKKTINKILLRRL